MFTAGRSPDTSNTAQYQRSGARGARSGVHPDHEPTVDDTGVPRLVRVVGERRVVVGLEDRAVGKTFCGPERAHLPPPVDERLAEEDLRSSVGCVAARRRGPARRAQPVNVGSMTSGAAAGVGDGGERERHRVLGAPHVREPVAAEVLLDALDLEAASRTVVRRCRGLCEVGLEGRVHRANAAVAAPSCAGDGGPTVHGCWNVVASGSPSAATRYAAYCCFVGRAVLEVGQRRAVDLDGTTGEVAAEGQVQRSRPR